MVDTSISADRESDRRRKMIAAATFAVSVGLPILAILSAGARDVEVQPGLIDWVFVAAIAIVNVAVFGLLVPWAEQRRAGATIGAALAIVSLLASVVAFWTMLPVILGVSGGWIAYIARGERWDAMTALTVAAGAVAAVGSVAGYIATS